MSGLGRASVYEWRGEEESFAEDWQKALEIGADLLEDEAVRRAKDGVEEPVYQGGKLVGHVQKYSDTLLIFLLKGAKPEKYRERSQHELSGAYAISAARRSRFQLLANGFWTVREVYQMTFPSRVEGGLAIHNAQSLPMFKFFQLGKRHPQLPYHE